MCNQICPVRLPVLLALLVILQVNFLYSQSETRFDEADLYLDRPNDHESVFIQEDLAMVGAFNADNDEGKVYVYRRDGDDWIEEAVLEASDGMADDEFGNVIAYDDNFAIIGAWHHNNLNGKVYIFEYQPQSQSWTEVAILTSPDGAQTSQQFGVDVDISGDFAVVGAVGRNIGLHSSAGVAYVYHKDANSNWSFTERLEADVPNDGMFFGDNVAIDGNRIITAGRGSDPDDQGAGFIFHYDVNTATWGSPFVLTASDASPDDLLGSDVEIEGDLAAVSSVTNGAIYIFEWNGTAWQEQAIIKACDVNEVLRFGYAMSIDNGDIIISNPNRARAGLDRAGVAYLFRKQGSAWQQFMRLLPEIPVQVFQGIGDEFGHGISMSAGRALVRSRTHAYIFDLNIEEDETKLLPGDRIDQPQSEFGRAVSVNGNVAIVGAPLNKNTSTTKRPGAVYIYRKSGSVWQEEQKHFASDGFHGELFGAAVAIENNLAVVGAPEDPQNGTAAGAVYILRYNGSVWLEESKLVPGSIDSWDRFGSAVAVEGNRVIVGAPNARPTPGGPVGVAYIFHFNGSSWIEETSMFAADGNHFKDFGTSVALNADLACVGAPRDDVTFVDQGSVYLYRHNGVAWQQEAKVVAAAPSASARFGNSVALSGATLLAGAHNHEVAGNRPGAAYVFRNAAGQWTEEQVLLAPESNPGAYFGYSLALQGNTALIGMPNYDNNHTCSESAGFAWIFQFDGTMWLPKRTLWASDAESYDHFGHSVSLGGDLALIGAPDEDLQKGAAYMYDITDCFGRHSPCFDPAAPKQFYRAYGHNERRDFANAIERSRDAHYLLAGHSDDIYPIETLQSYFWDASLVKTDCDGHLIWQYNYDESTWAQPGQFTLEEFHNVKEVADGYVMVGWIQLGWETGSQTGPPYALADKNILIVKTTTEGDILWSRVYGIDTYDQEAFDVLESTHDGSYVLTGYAARNVNKVEAFLMSVDPFDGHILWQQSYDYETAPDNYAYALDEVDDNDDNVADGYILTGWTNLLSLAIDPDILVVKTDLNGGFSQLAGPNFIARYYSQTNDWAKAYDIKQTSDGGFAICGELFNDATLLRIANVASIGTWHTYGTGTNDAARSVAQCDDGGFILGGESLGFRTGYIPLLIKTDAQGADSWSQVYGDLVLGTSDYGRDVLQTPEGGFALAGHGESFGPGWGDMQLIKTDQQGIISNCVHSSAGLGETPVTNRLMFSETLPSANAISFTSINHGLSRTRIEEEATLCSGLAKRSGPPPTQPAIPPTSVDGADARLEIYPNPVRDGLLSIRLLLSERSSVNLSLNTLPGVQVHSQTLELAAGRHTVTIDIGDLTDGCYVIQALGDSWQTAGMLVVQ